MDDGKLATTSASVTNAAYTAVTLAITLFNLVWTGASL